MLFSSLNQKCIHIFVLNINSYVHIFYLHNAINAFILDSEFDEKRIDFPKNVGTKLRMYCFFQEQRKKQVFL